LIEDNKPDYYLALRNSQKTFTAERADINPWLSFFLRIIVMQSEKAVEILSLESIESILSVKQLAVWNYLNTVEEALPINIAKHASVARPTVNQALSKLMKLGKVERIGAGSSTRYRKKVLIP
jgi:DNA-binding MarR family transcriptional regulator